MLNAKDARSRQSQAGFTLIELSIVLVIIGLLVGGVLKGQELIAGTRVKATVAQADALRAAVNTFQDRFRGVPGDMTAAAIASTGLAARGAAVSGGPGVRGDGQVATALAGIATAINAGVNNEPSNFLAHLSMADLVTGVQAPENTALTQYPGRMAGSFFAVGLFTVTSPGGAGGGTINRHYARIGGGNGYTVTPLVSATDANDMDNKYDDGRTDQGDIRATVGGTCSAGAGIAAVYTANTGADCQIGFQLF